MLANLRVNAIYIVLEDFLYYIVSIKKSDLVCETIFDMSITTMYNQHHKEIL